MVEYTISDVAGRAGAAQDYVSRLVELGVVSVGHGGDFSESDVRRVRLMQTLDRAGVPLEEVAAAIRRGDLSRRFLEMSHYARLSSLMETPNLGKGGSMAQWGQRNRGPFTPEL